MYPYLIANPSKHAHEAEEDDQRHQSPYHTHLDNERLLACLFWSLRRDPWESHGR